MYCNCGLFVFLQSLVHGDLRLPKRQGCSDELDTLHLRNLVGAEHFQDHRHLSSFVYDLDQQTLLLMITEPIPAFLHCPGPRAVVVRPERVGPSELPSAQRQCVHHFSYP